MSDQNQSSGQNQDSVNQDQNQEKKDVVSYETHQKLLGEKKKRDEELREAKSLLGKYEAEKKELEEKSLREKEDFKKLFESRDSELKVEREKRIAIETQIIENRKLKSFLNAVDAPIEQKFWGLIDLDKIPVGEDGLPDDIATKAYAEDFKKNFWEVCSKGSGAKMPNESTGREQAGLTYEAWLKLPPNEQRKRLKEVI